jgi:flavin-dependent dehydrogenase
MPEPRGMSDRTSVHRHDVVVVGSRCAGASTAMLLAGLGHDVCVVDRTQFPSDTLSTHAIARGGVVQLRRWGLLDEVLATGAPPIRQVSFHAGGAVDTRVVKDRAGVDHLVAPRRHVLDPILVRAAARAGATVRAGVWVEDVLRDGTGRATGVAGRDTEGRPVRIEARIVVGADGLRSRVAGQVGAPIIDQRPGNGTIRYGYVAGLDADGIEFHIGNRLFAGVFPTNSGECNVWIGGPDALIGGTDRGAARRVSRRDGRATTDRITDLIGQISAVSPGLAARLRAAEFTSPVRAFRRMPNQVRQAAGAGWALVGDAGYFRDAVTGHGISDAFRDAELLARALHGLLSGHRTEADALADYGRQRDAAIAELFEIAAEMSTYPEQGRFVELQKALSGAIEAEALALAARPDVRAAIPAAGGVVAAA